MNNKALVLLSFVLFFVLFGCKKEEPPKPVKQESPVILMLDPVIFPGPDKKQAAAKQEYKLSVDLFFLAIRTKESSDGQFLVGDGGASLGPYQIQKPYWNDACEYGGVFWDYNTLVYSDAHCKQVMEWYWKRYCKQAWLTKNWQVLARVYNGGPNGMSKGKTIIYWYDIENIMDSYRKDK